VVIWSVTRKRRKVNFGGGLTGAIHKRYIQSSLKAALQGAVLPQHVPEWWNWQTRRTQNPVGLTARVGSSPSSGTILLINRCDLLLQFLFAMAPVTAFVEDFASGRVEMLLGWVNRACFLQPVPGVSSLLPQRKIPRGSL
jgi:hypothetical protein